MSEGPYQPIFLAARIVSLNNLTADIKIIPPGTPKGSDPRSIVLAEPDPAPAHMALGMFMDAWSRLEMMLSMLLEKMIKVSPGSMPVLMNNLGIRGAIESLESLGSESLDGETNRKLTKLTDRIRSANTRRNHIVHGYWMTETVVGEFRGKLKTKVCVYRVYDPSSPAVRKDLEDPKNKAARSAYMFGISRLNQLSSELERLRIDLVAFRITAYGG